jgi:fumarate reductase subunit D
MLAFGPCLLLGACISAALVALQSLHLPLRVVDVRNEVVVVMVRAICRACVVFRTVGSAVDCGVCRCIDFVDLAADLVEI